MGTKNNNALFYTCSLIEYIGRRMKRTRCEVTDYMGKNRIKRIYEYADVFHCEPIEKTADEFIEETNMTEGSFDNVKECRYTVPGYWDIGEDGIWEIYHSWIDGQISDYNTDFYYQPRDYIAECYKAGVVL